MAGSRGGSATSVDSVESVDAARSASKLRRMLAFSSEGRGRSEPLGSAHGMPSLERKRMRNTECAAHNSP